jgi:hypothetical protein
LKEVWIVVRYLDRVSETLLSEGNALGEQVIEDVET